METAKHIIIVLVLGLFVTGNAASSEEKISNTRQANCIIQVTINQSTLHLSPDAIKALIYSSSVKGKAYSKILDLPLTYPVPIINVDTIQGNITSSDIKTYLFGLSVSLEEYIKPVAEEFLQAIVRNLRASLEDAFEKYQADFYNQLATAEAQYNHARSQFDQLSKNNEKKGPAKPLEITYSDLSQADRAVYELFEREIDLSGLSPDMSFEEVIKIIENSVEPPLQIQPNWRDLAETAEITQSTPCEMDPLTNVKVRTVLEVLLAGLSSDFADLDYIVNDGTIIIATTEALPPDRKSVV